MADCVEYFVGLALQNVTLGHREAFTKKVEKLMGAMNEQSGMLAYMMKRCINAEARELILRELLERMHKSRQAHIGKIKVNHVRRR